MSIDLQAAANEYIGWLQLEANRSPNTVRAYDAELKKLIVFLHESGHTLQLADLRHEDLRAYQRLLATRLKSPASRARALVAVRSWLRWVAREGFIDRDLSNGITLPKLEQRLPKPIDSDELARLLAALPSGSGPCTSPPTRAPRWRTTSRPVKTRPWRCSSITTGRLPTTGTGG